MSGPSISTAAGRSSPPSTRHLSSTRALPASCIRCRHRKIKCDRSVPCGNCVAGSAECVPFVPARLPRGRQGGRKKSNTEQLLLRLAKLEAMVQNANEAEPPVVEQLPHPSRAAPPNTDRSLPLSNDSPCTDTNAATTETLPESARSKTHLKAQRTPASISFYKLLDEAISGFRDILQSDSDSGDETCTSPIALVSPTSQHSPRSLPLQTQRQESNMASLVMSPRNAKTPQALIRPSRHQVYNLCEIFLSHVDNVVKIMHGPSLRRYLQEDAPALDGSPGEEGLEALR